MVCSDKIKTPTRPGNAGGKEKNMEWRIRESGHGGYVAEKGIYHEGGYTIQGIQGCTMPAFILYEMARFDTRKQAEKYIKNHPIK